MAEYKSLPFDQAINFFRSKVDVPTAGWRDVWQQEHDTAFVVAGATKAALLADFRQAVDDAIAQGKTRAEFQKDFDRIVETHGWQHRGGREWRANIIYSTNLKTAYAAGRYEQMTDPDVLKMRPYWMWKHGNSPEPRLHHLALNGKVFLATDTFWDTQYPPSGWGCKCLVVSLSKRDLERKGKTAPDQPPRGNYQWTNPETGITHLVTSTADPGWGYAPGRSTQKERTKMLTNILQNLPDDLRYSVEQDAVKQIPEASDVHKQGIFKYLVERQYQGEVEVTGVPELDSDNNLIGYFRDGRKSFYCRIAKNDNGWTVKYERNN